MKRKVMILLIAGLMVIGSLSGCSSASNDKAETETFILTAEEADRLAEETARWVKEEAEARANEDYEAGYAYLYGLDGKEVDLEAAYTNFKYAAELGKIEANFYLGLLCDWYGYPEQDPELARAYYEECGDDPYAQLALGYLYYNGEGVEEDKERAKELWQSVIDQGYVEGYLGFGDALRDEGEYEAALENYINASEGTEITFIRSAMNEIGYMYNNGKGVEQDSEKALKWYEKAADLGNAAAIYNIGCMYLYGDGVEQDFEKALEWYEKAADLGDAAAMNNIGNMYYNGDGVEQDYEVALEWYEKAADLGFANAMNNIGHMYDFGIGVEQDSEKALEWYEKAANMGN